MTFLMKYSKEGLLLAVGLSGLLLSFSASAQSDVLCIQVIQKPDRDSGTANQNHCVKRGLGDLCLDVLHSVDIRNVCNRQVRIEVSAGRSIMTPGYVGAGETVYASCEEKRDDCTSISVSVLSEKRTDEPSAQHNRTKSPMQGGDPDTDEAEIDRLLEKQKKWAAPKESLEGRKKQMHEEFLAKQREIADRRAREQAEAEARTQELDRLRATDAARRQQERERQQMEASQSEPIGPTASQPMCSSQMISPNRSYNECIDTCSFNSCVQSECRSECFNAAIQYNQSPCQPTQCN
ncbi:hypothetical protein GOB57_21180 [Sinorhizobium meliloti]|nr:hypothetical protein [Sinorhizobium meliloti]